MSDIFLKLSRNVALAEAAAVIGYIMADPLRQEILKSKYIALLKTAERIEFTAESGDYSEKEPTYNGLTLDQVLDDPRRGQGGKY